jgi:protein JBTS26
VEIFDFLGTPVKISRNNIRGNDINILESYDSDPRTIEKLIDGVYFTRDDLHVWLSPYTKGELHTVTFNFNKITTLSMLRIWNYNKSRIHSFRGAKDIIIYMDDKRCIFQGQIKKSSGLLTDMRECCEIIMFTNEDKVIKQIQAHDWVNSYVANEGNFFNIDFTVKRRNSSNCS